jgi:opacity protein-like surface antigen
MRISHWMQGLATAILLAAIYTDTARAQTSLALSVYGAFSGATNGNGVQESPANAAGGLFEFRHISNPILGWEATYAYNRANQTYTSCGLINPLCREQSISANAHEITGDWVPSVHVANVRLFALLGAGVLLNVPAGSQSNTTSDDKAVYDYGAGLDWRFIPHIGVRFQYRGNLYKTPDVSTLFTSTSAFTHTAEPVLGAYFSF